MNLALPQKTPTVLPEWSQKFPIIGMGGLGVDMPLSGTNVLIFRWFLWKVGHKISWNTLYPNDLEKPASTDNREKSIGEEPTIKNYKSQKGTI